MATQLEIVNKALGHISIAPITSMVESSPAAILANSIWDTCRQDCLRNHDWPFATVITALSTTNSTILHNDWTYAYAYPTDALEVWNVYYNYTDKSPRFRVVYDKTAAARLILSDTSEALAEYTYDQTITTPWDAYFVSVMSYFLAANMALPLTGNASLKKEMLDIYTAMMSDAERMSSYETDVDTTRASQSAFVDAREGSSQIVTEDHYVAVRHPNG
jgi:hypothetical protein